MRFKPRNSRGTSGRCIHPCFGDVEGLNPTHCSNAEVAMLVKNRINALKDMQNLLIQRIRERQAELPQNAIDSQKLHSIYREIICSLGLSLGE